MPPILEIRKFHEGDFVRGNVETLFIQAFNAEGGEPTLGEVEVTDTLPPALTPVDVSAPGWACTIDGQTVNCTRDDSISGGDSYPLISIDVDVSLDAPDIVLNTATAVGGNLMAFPNIVPTDPDVVISAPTIKCPKNIEVVKDPCICGAVVKFDKPFATGDNVKVRCTPKSGTCFPIGETKVVCTATDSFGNVANCSFIVNVLETKPCNRVRYYN